MNSIPARIRELNIDPGRRVLVMSDIHANVPYFEGVLEKAGFCADDELIIDGDFLEKGSQNVALLRRIMNQVEEGHTHVICGNCDDWADMYVHEKADEWNPGILRYMQWKKSGLLWELCTELGIDPMKLTDLREAKEQMRIAFPEIWDFLKNLPHAMYTEKFVFAHAGMNPHKPLREQTRTELDRTDALLTTDWSYDRWLIVGHWPVMLYGENIVSANPIIDRKRRIVSIDGGCTLKDDGQLNCLILPDITSDDFSFIAYDPFPTALALDDQQAGERSYYIRWGDSRVQVLERGKEFSHCRHIRTGYEMDILTKYLFTEEEYTNCNDCTDYILPINAGDELRIVEETSRGFFVKRKGVSGWYFGRLQR